MALTFVTISAILFLTANLSQVVSSVTVNLVDSTVNFNVSIGATQARPLDRQHVGMSIECGSIVSFLGDVNQANNFSRQLLQNVEDRTGVPPILRLGGTTFDVSFFCEDCPYTLKRIYEPNGLGTVNITYSKDLFRVMAENMGMKQKYIFQLNYGTDDIHVAMAQLAGSKKYLDQSRLYAYEVGNEPNAFFYTKQRPENWTVLDYANDMLQWLPTLKSLGGADFPGFQLGAFVGPPVGFADWSLLQLVTMGIPQAVGEVKTFSSHAYPENACTEQSAALVKVEDFVNHLNTIQYFSGFLGEIAAAKSIGAKFHMGETNTVGCHGKDGVSNTVGALLWMIDYSLLSATLNMDRIFFHNGVGNFKYNMWEPISVNSSMPHVNPQYYTLPFIGDVISGLSSPHVYRLVHLDTYDLAHYAIYDGGRVKKMVIINMHYYNVTTEERSRKIIDLSPVMGKNITLKRLTAPSTVAKTGVTWAGQSVDATGTLVGDMVMEHSSNGKVVLFASEAVIVEES